MPENAQIGARLREFGEKQFSSMADFATALGISSQNLAGYLSGRRKPGNKMLARLRKLGADIIWLEHGISSASVNEKFKKSVETILENQTGKVALTREEIAALSSREYRIEATVPAGDAEFTDRTDSYETEKIDYDPKTHIWLQVSDVVGESMRPTMKPGDMCLVSRFGEIRNGDLVAVRWDGDKKGAIKIYMDLGNGMVALTSANNTIAPMIFPKTKIKAYRVVLTRYK